MQSVHVIMTVKNTEGGTKINDYLLSQTPTAKFDVMELDISFLASVRNFAAHYCSSDPINRLWVENIR